MQEIIRKQQEITQIFSEIPSAEAKYEKIIAYGRNLPPLAEAYKTLENIVSGCQSIVYLRAYTENGKLLFAASSEALISAGLAALLIAVYSGHSAEEILTCPPTFLEQIGLASLLTPSRSNGLAHMHQRMKQEALKRIMITKEP